jgi:hypothetical protein
MKREGTHPRTRQSERVVRLYAMMWTPPST